MVKYIYLIIVFSFISFQTFGQQVSQQWDSISQFKYFISIPYLNLTNFDPELAIHYEMHIGHRMTSKDFIGIKAVTWKLVAPLGIPLGPYLANKSENYSGKLCEFGVGVFYQRFLWKGLSTSVEVVPLKKKYLDANGKKIDDGFRLYTSFHLGYYIPLFKNRMYIQPQVQFNYWPINTKSPIGFAEQDKKWNNNYFLFEPNLYIGINF